MAFVRNVEISGPQGIGARETASVSVAAEIEFTPLEERLDATYYTNILLYEIDGVRDLYSIQVNRERLLVQRANRGGWDQKADDWSRRFDLRPADGRLQTIRHTFNVSASLDPPNSQMEFRAAVVCRPEYGGAIWWSDELPMWSVVD